MLEDFADLPPVRYPMQPDQRRALALRETFTAYHAFYLALAESLSMPLLTDDRQFAQAPAHMADLETWL
ncbi:MAG: type II toxin-antitoxin system VapC family toxin [Ornithinimicrobium sp.]